MIRTTPKAPVKRATNQEVQEWEEIKQVAIEKIPPTDTPTIRRGRPPSDTSKQLISLRLDRDVVAKFRASGEGWMTRINDTLKAAKV